MDEPIKPPSQQAKRFFDVMPPSKTQPSATSRPIIVGNQPQQADTMLTAPPEPTASAPATPSAADASPAAEPVSTAAVPPTETTPESESAAEQQMQEEYVEVRHELPAGEAQEALPATTAEAAPQPAAQTPDSPTETPEPQPEAAAQPVVTNQPVVAHHQKPRSLAKDLLLMLLLLVVVLAVLDGLLDTGTWKPNTNLPHTHFFNK